MIKVRAYSSICEISYTMGDNKLQEDLNESEVIDLIQNLTEAICDLSKFLNDERFKYKTKFKELDADFKKYINERK